MSELENIEDVAAVTLSRGNVGSRPDRNCRFGWSISPNIERASVAREQQKPAPEPVVTAPVVETAPRPRAPAAARTIADYTEFVEAIRDRADELGMTRLELDRLSGLASGHSGKLLGAKRVKRFGFASLGPMLGAIGCRLVLMEDTAQTAKIRARVTPVDRDKQRFGNKSNSKQPMPAIADR